MHSPGYCAKRLDQKPHPLCCWLACDWPGSQGDCRLWTCGGTQPLSPGTSGTMGLILRRVPCKTMPGRPESFSSAPKPHGAQLRLMKMALSECGTPKRTLLERITPMERRKPSLNPKVPPTLCVNQAVLPGLLKGGSNAALCMPCLWLS